MKPILILLLLLSTCLIARGQNKGQDTFFQTHSKTHLYYVALSPTDAKVYEMGSYFDKAGTGYSIRHTDTLVRQPGGLYTGKNKSVASEGINLYLVTEGKKEKRLLLDTVKSSGVVNHNLNNAYYLDHYFRMSEELNKAYSLYRHSFRDGFYSWKQLPNKEMDHEQFRAFARQRLNAIKDSVGQLQDRYVLLTNYLVQNVGTLDYPALKDSLVKLPAAYSSASGYYVTTIQEVAKQSPGYFFRLAEDFPDHRSLIFSAAGDTKEVLQGLRAVEGYTALKKEFFKKRRFEKTIPYRVIGTYALFAGLITFLIVGQ